MLTDGRYEYTEYTPKKGAGNAIKGKLKNVGELLGFCKRQNCKVSFYRIRFFDCGHECFIRVGKNLECNNKECVSKKMSAKRKIVFNEPEYKERMRRISKEVQSRPEVREKHSKSISEYWKNEENRKHVSEMKKEYFSDLDNRKAQSERLKNYFSDARNREKTSEATKKWYAEMSDEKKDQMNRRRLQTFNTPEYKERNSKIHKELFSDRDFKLKYLDSKACTEREKRNPDEMLFMRMLEDSGIEYVWQVPFVTETEKDYILDFYLPKFDVYVNIDGGIHGIDRKPGNPIVDKKREDDRQLDLYCKNNNIKLCHVNTRELRSVNYNIKEVFAS